MRANAQATPGTRLGLRKPLIRGWANYHRPAARQQTFAKGENARFWPLGHGANRRQPHNPRRGLKDQDFPLIGHRPGGFGGARPGKPGRPHRVPWFSAPRGRSNRHPKITGAANPSEPAGEISCEHRRGVTMADNLQGRRKRLELWQEHQGRCPVCRQAITHLTGGHTHPLRWRSQGGAEGFQG
jgi:RNA-directed DNA polymerase